MSRILNLLVFIIISLASLSCATSSMKVTDKYKAKEISYMADGKEMIGYLVTPRELKNNTPGILVVHEWWGQTDYPRRRAEMLAEMGYVAMAVDMYGGRKTANHPKDAGMFAKSVMANAQKVHTPFDAAYKALLENTKVEKGNVAAVGYCFGGSVVLEMARQGYPLKGVASFHGGLITPTKAKRGKVKAKVFVANGKSDRMVKKKDIVKFKREMKWAQVGLSFYNYKDAMHGFTNPEATEFGKKLKIPLAYNEKADKESWKKLDEFLKELFKNP